MNKKFSSEVSFISFDTDKELFIRFTHEDLKSLMIYVSNVCEGLEKEFDGLRLLEIKIISNEEF